MIVKLTELKNNVCGIYKLNYPNGKIYIGQSTDIKRRMYEHNNINRLKSHPKHPCDQAIAKYGRFEEIEILELVEDSNQLNEREKYWIAYFKSNNKDIGYNLTIGGDSLQGENHANAKLTNEEVLNIRKRRFKGERKKDVYKDFQNRLSFSGFEKIWLGISYNQIGKEFIIPPHEISRQEYSSKANSGENNGRAKLTKEDVIKIRQLFDSGTPISDIVEQFKNIVTIQTIRSVCNRQTWKNV